jgi:hypothetical protein
MGARAESQGSCLVRVRRESIFLSGLDEWYSSRWTNRRSARRARETDAAKQDLFAVVRRKAVNHHEDSADHTVFYPRFADAR